MQGKIQSGRVIAMRTIEFPPATTSGSSSGASASGAAASGTDGRSFTPALVTVQFADGTQMTYSVEKHERDYFTLGDPVSVISDGESMVIMAP